MRLIFLNTPSRPEAPFRGAAAAMIPPPRRTAAIATDTGTKNEEFRPGAFDAADTGSSAEDGFFGDGDGSAADRPLCSAGEVSSAAGAVTFSGGV